MFQHISLGNTQPTNVHLSTLPAAATTLTETGRDHDYDDPPAEVRVGEGGAEDRAGGVLGRGQAPP